jgi:hypothetical protein
MKEIKTSNDLKELLDKFRALKDDTSEQSYFATVKLLKTELDLPSFYTFKEPTPVYDAKVVATPEGPSPFVVYVKDDQGVPFNDGQPFLNLSSAYDAIKEVKGDCVFSGDLDVAKIKRAGGMVMENNRLLLSITDEEKIGLVKHDYLTWLFLTEEYRKNPNDFLHAFRWVRSHPAFWSRSTPESHYWETNYSDFWFEVSRSETGELVYMLEAGSAVEPERTSHYHDLRLDVYAPSFEEAYIKLASLVDKFFNIDGSERQNVAYEPSELEKTLTERLSSYENERKYNDEEEDETGA